MRALTFRSSVWLSFLCLPLRGFGDTAYTASSDYDYGSLGINPVQNFTSSALHPPAINIKTGAGSSDISSNYTIIAYRGGDETYAAPVILDNEGSLIWSGELDYGATMDLMVQTYKGEPVLTLFQGPLSAEGYGLGNWAILGQDYKVITTVSYVNQSNATDFHEFVITANNTALVDSWQVTSFDLTDVGGPVDGYTWNCIFQEIDIETNELLFEWRSLDYVYVSASYFAIGDTGTSADNPYDYCHMNSLEKDEQGNYLVSLRGPSTIYSIDGKTGEIIWQLGGGNSNFSQDDNATFWYQHHARLLSPITASPILLSLFDNANGGSNAMEPEGRGMILSLDQNTMTATMETEYLASFGLTIVSQGSVQVLDNGNVFVGWGSEPYYSEYAQNGTLLYDVHFASDNSSAFSYRAFKQAWVGLPATNPDFAIQSTAAYISWNGATEVARWMLLGGNELGSMMNLSSAAKEGFETQMPLTNGYGYYAAVALASNGTCIGATEIWAAANTSSTGTLASCPTGTTNSTTSPASSGSPSSSSGSVSCSIFGHVVLPLIAGGVVLLSVAW